VQEQVLELVLVQGLVLVQELVLAQHKLP